MRTRVKICCIKSRAEAELAIRYGADALGLVSAMPSGPGPISDEDARYLADRVPPGIPTFLLTSLQSATAIIAQQKRIGAGVIQIVDALTQGTYAEIHNALPGVRLVQVIHVRGEDSLREAVTVAPEVDALLLDSGNVVLPVKTLGGAGQTHDWTISRRIVEAVSRPVFLAGGLNAGNVRAAIEMVRPFAVDICSGVRTDDRLDETKLAEFMAQMGQPAQ